MSQRAVLLDTSFILALENRNDSHHELAKSLDHELFQENALLILHWGILFEIGDGYARLGRREKGRILLQRIEKEARYSVSPITDALFQAGLEPYQSRSDKEWSLTDCASFVLMTRESITEALTADTHFRQAGSRHFCWTNV